jgi:hypothetical protein
MIKRQRPSLKIVDLYECSLCCGDGITDNEDKYLTQQSKSILPNLAITGNTPTLKKAIHFWFLRIVMVSRNLFVDKVLITS